MTASGNGNGNISFVPTSSIFDDTWAKDNPMLKVQSLNLSDNHIMYFSFGTISSNTTEAKDGINSCIQIIPSSTDYYTTSSYYAQATEGEGINISFFAKKDASFNGEVQTDVLFLKNEIVSSSTIYLSTDYSMFTVNIDGSNITGNGFAELRIKVNGTAGNVYVDEFFVD